ncbi:MAG: PSD1 and planctomycete cytochrome C domain-containing protein, partial [Planctomycetes bacterium]|nr:PSD1 and planctomycete cytochrome C domain-containing protein [Planctomycetota bacterium]
MRSTIAASLVVLGFQAGLRADDAAGLDFFETKIRPILTEHCIACHGASKQKGGLRLDSKVGWEKGGDSGPAIVPGKVEKSPLIRMVRGGQGSLPKMPPDSRLPDKLVADLVKWVEMGAPDPRQGKIEAKREIDWNTARAFWSFQPVKAPTIPSVKNPRWQQPIDRFIGQKLEASQLEPSERADKWTLLRRATLDLTGLPPTLAEVEAFAKDDSPAAFAKVIDRLLASPRYGEHQARYWLDLARYAEDQAHSSGAPPNLNAWRYRDWVIDSFNQDMPYDHFLKLQLAADLLEQPGDDPKHRGALGFIGLGAVYYKNSDILRGVAEELDDRIDTMTRGMLGLTVACARCHDHKFDPIPTQDYYSLAGIFNSIKLEPIPVAPRDIVEAYEIAKARSTEANKKAKDALQVEKDRVALSMADRIAAYMLAAWKFEAKKLTDSATTLDEIAKLAALDKEVLQRMIGYLNRSSMSNYLVEWVKNKPRKDGPTEPTQEARQAAEGFVKKVKDNFSKAYVMRNLDIQKDLFEDKGVFRISEEDALIGASDAAKKEYTVLKAAAFALAAKVPPELPMAHGVVEAKAADMKVYLRGNPYKLGEVAPRRFLRIVAGDTPPLFKQGSGRLELAEAIADPKNPLTARVIVNRIWQQHFGRGIVATASNLGILGEKPTHPELLDYSADQFVKQGWSLKKLHREILLSETYQRSAQVSSKNFEVDPENLLLSHM